jgi:Domain of unknown function (DUF4276)
MRLGLVVEGDGEVAALPILVRRHLHENRAIYDIEVAKPKNSKGRGNLEAPGGVERYTQHAALPDDICGVLVLCDSDADPVCEFGPAMHERARGAVPTKPVVATLAVAEFENWIVASGETLGADELPDDVDYENLNAESIIRAWRFPRSYVKPLHQPGYAQKLDFKLVEARCPSFARLLRCIDELIEKCKAAAGQ